MNLRKKDWIASSLRSSQRRSGGVPHSRLREPTKWAWRSRNLSSLMTSPPFGGGLLAMTEWGDRHCEERKLRSNPEIPKFLS
jgi:hypothetical protein